MTAHVVLKEEERGVSDVWRKEKRKEKWRQWRPPLKTGLFRFRVRAQALLIKTLQKETSNPCAPLHNSQTSCGTSIAFQFKGTFSNTESTHSSLTAFKTPLILCKVFLYGPAITLQNTQLISEAWRKLFFSLSVMLKMSSRGENVRMGYKCCVDRRQHLTSCLPRGEDRDQVTM